MATIFDGFLDSRGIGRDNSRGIGRNNCFKSARASPPLRIPVGCKAIIDTCTHIHGNMEAFWKVTAPELIKHNVEIMTPMSCMNEILRLSKRKDDPHTAALAVKAWNSIIEHQNAGLCQIYGDPDDNTHADPVFLYVILKYRHRFPILVITQDNDLAHDIHSINKLKSTHCRNEVKAVRLMNDGTLQERKQHV